MRNPRMVPSDPNQHTPEPRPTGDLEHLFRQKFADAEVHPRASLWEQLDHELLVQQNETYRRRLLGYRWAAAASLLLLAGGGTWLSLQPNAPAVATAPGQEAAASATGRATTTEARPGTGAPAYRPPYQLAGRRAPASGPAAATTSAATLSQREGGAAESNSYAVAAAGPAYSNFAGEGATSRLGLQGSSGRGSMLRAALLPETYASGVAPAGFFGAAYSSRSGEALLGRAARLPDVATSDAARPELLPPAAAPQLVAGQLPAAAPEQAQEQLQELPPPAKARRWKLNAAYAASAFNPNADFSRTASTAVHSYAGLAAVRSAADAYEVAAAEYRDKLQPGLSQQFAVLADHSLNDHWSVAAGLALGQQQATSASSWNFQDGKSATASFYEPATVGNGTAMRPSPSMPLRNVRYRYRTAGVPVQVRYTTTPRQGWALYAKLGAAVQVLLSSRTELEGVPEATATYKLTSADSPYRKVLASLHGGVGARFQPANAAWRLALGPKVEGGLTTLNHSPSANLLHRRRPYAIGLEASMEFGSGKVAPVALR